MKKETFLGVSFKKDETKNIAFKEDDTENKTTIKDMRSRILRTAAEEDIELSDFKFKKFLNDKGMFKESKEADGISVNDIKVKNKKVVNEVKFASGSLLEGFLAFYGVELDKSLDKYERRLHVIEENNAAFIGKVDRNGDLKKVSPEMDKNQAIERLRDFEKQRELKKNRELENDLQIQLEREGKEKE
ncbi:hypothetical protein DTX80_17720 [Bacilli bacterium]|nr:hypothetical protein WH51_11485 [Bacilli bacterium VT-13-104]PZD83164.1 hypothetical protein DEJ64_15960 [Bacilli bacterium]PZD84276.1 hypothetical protein DEJ60_14980 [Bacilli bacterium]PZD86303.1 hypothetical protein DEJ66_15700 [Bacilli bacterium]RCO04288.1 hypothetical protein DTX80_17720 [Bacilli bacterium]